MHDFSLQVYIKHLHKTLQILSVSWNESTMEVYKFQESSSVEKDTKEQLLTRVISSSFKDIS